MNPSPRPAPSYSVRARLPRSHAGPGAGVCHAPDGVGGWRVPTPEPRASPLTQAVIRRDRPPTPTPPAHWTPACQATPRPHSSLCGHPLGPGGAHMGGRFLLGGWNSDGLWEGTSRLWKWAKAVGGGDSGILAFRLCTGRARAPGGVALGLGEFLPTGRDTMCQPMP